MTTLPPPTPSPGSGPGPLFGLQVLLLILAYWSPTIYALARGKYNVARIALTNFWAFLAVPWLAAWIAAVTSPRKPPPVYYRDYPPPVAAPPAPQPATPPGFEAHTILLPKDSEGTP